MRFYDERCGGRQIFSNLRSEHWLNSLQTQIIGQVNFPHFVKRQKIGLGGGRAVFAFAKSLPNFVKVNRLHFYALSVFRDSLVSIADAEKAIGELVVDSRWKHSENGKEFEAVLAVYKAHQYGGPLFNYLATDEACAAEMLRLAGYPKRMSGLPNRSEWLGTQEPIPRHSLALSSNMLWR